MTLPHDTATARVTVDGLAICCFNSSERKWDFGFLRHPNPPFHTLILQVEGSPPLRLPEDTGLISFETVNGDFPSGFPRGFFDNGPIGDRTIDPVTPDEKENFRWAIDLEDSNEVPHGIATLKQPDFFPVTRAFIHDAVFYTTERSPQNLILVPGTQNPNQIPNPPIFGKTNDEIAADIFCDASGRLDIKIDGIVRFRLDHRPGNPWNICLTNLCLVLPDPTARYEKGDFHLFYDALEITGQQHALWGEPLAGMVHCPPRTSFLRPRQSGRTDCDTVRLGTSETLDRLFT